MKFETFFNQKEKNRTTTAEEDIPAPPLSSESQICSSKCILLQGQREAPGPLHSEMPAGFQYKKIATESIPEETKIEFISMDPQKRLQ